MTVEVDRNYLAMLEKAYEEYKRLTESKEKLTNYEKIKNMSIEEMVEFIDNPCLSCAFRYKDCRLSIDCKKGIKQ